MNILILGDKNRNSKISRFLEKENTIIQTEDVISLDFLKTNDIDFLISNGYAPIIKEPIISEYHHKIINIHPTFLPYGRGIYPLLWSLLESTPIGITIHFINNGIDSGEILFQKEISLDDNFTLKQGYEVLLKEAEKLFLIHWKDIVTKQYTLKIQHNLELYRSRNVSEKYIDILYSCWDTKIKDVKKLSYFYKMNKVFLDNLNNWSKEC